jgi:type VI protein secretion system component Hcp
MSDTVIYLEIDMGGKKLLAGESTAAGFVDQIEIESFSWGLTAKHTDLAALKSAKAELRTEVRPQHLIVNKHFDLSSTNLAMYAYTRKPFEKATLTFSDLKIQMQGAVTTRSQPVLTIELLKGFIEDVSVSTAAGQHSIAVKEAVKLSFKEMSLQYSPIDPKVASRGAVMKFLTRQPSAGG